MKTYNDYRGGEYTEPMGMTFIGTLLTIALYDAVKWALLRWVF